MLSLFRLVADRKATLQPDNDPIKRAALFMYLNKHRPHGKTAVFISIAVLALAVTVPCGVWAASNGQNGDHPSANVNNINSQTHMESKSMTDDSKASDQQKKAEQSTGNNSATTTVNVNGENIEVPANGSYSKTTTDSNGQTKVDVQSSNQSSSTSSNGSASNNSSSSVNINVNSHSSSESSD